MKGLGLLACAFAVVLVAATALAADRPFPEVIALPDGFAPEGIAIADGTFYVGSIPTGAVYRGDVRTGAGAVLVPAGSGRAAIGIDIDRERIFVAGGSTGHAFVYDRGTGALLRSYRLTTESTFVNDVVVTSEGAYFTDSLRQFVYRVAIGPGGALAPSADAIPLSGDIAYTDGFNANGIDATADGKTLVIVQSNVGRLFTVDPRSGATRLIALSGGDVTQGDGLLLDGTTLYVVRNRQNRVAVVELAPDLGSGRIVRYLTDPDFDVPTTIDDLGTRLYAVNARFGTPVTAETKYEVVQFSKR
jgi:sugar lactone lactonase YvrE